MLTIVSINHRTALLLAMLLCASLNAMSQKKESLLIEIMNADRSHDQKNKNELSFGENTTYKLVTDAVSDTEKFIDKHPEYVQQIVDIITRKIRILNKASREDFSILQYVQDNNFFVGERTQKSLNMCTIKKKSLAKKTE